MTDICQICDQRDSIYACPRCNVLYCSVACYKSDKHLQCSEPFYEQCVKEELSLQGKDPKALQDILEIIKKHKTQEEEEDDETELDSDDEGLATVDLANRLSSIDLDDSEAVWASLTDAERQKFKQCVQSGEIIEILPEWQPWWKKKRKLVTEEVGKGEEEKETGVPTVPQDIPALSTLTKMMPSLQVPFMIFNLLLSYVFTGRHFKGQHQEMPADSATLVLTLSESLSTGKVFDDLMSSYLSFEERVSQIDCLSYTEDNIQTASDDVTDILKGDLWCTKAAICDMQGLIQGAIVAMKASKDSNLSRYSKTPVTVKELKIAAKKLTYYLSWTHDYGTQLTRIINYLP